MNNYIMIPIVVHRDPVIKLGKTIENIQDNMISFLNDYYNFPDDYDKETMDICYRIRDYKYSSIEELMIDCRKMCIGYIIK